MAKVLIVDDSILQRGLIRHMLAAAGHDSIEAASGDEALEVLTSLAPDCLVLDLLMPFKSGLQVLRELRARGITTPVICTAACEEESTQRACRDLGAEGWLLKPIDEGELGNEVERVLTVEEPRPTPR